MLLKKSVFQPNSEADAAGFLHLKLEHASVPMIPSEHWNQILVPLQQSAQNKWLDSDRSNNPIQLFGFYLKTSVFLD